MEQPPLPPSPPRVSPGSSTQANQWAMFIHLGVFAGYVIPFAGLLLPIILWQIKKEEFPSIDAHGKMVVNFMISLVIYFVGCMVLTLVLIGVLGLVALAVIGVVFPVIGGIKANNGELWEYPLTIKFLR